MTRPREFWLYKFGKGTEAIDYLATKPDPSFDLDEFIHCVEVPPEAAPDNEYKMMCEEAKGVMDLMFMISSATLFLSDNQKIKDAATGAAEWLKKYRALIGGQDEI